MSNNESPETLEAKSLYEEAHRRFTQHASWLNFDLLSFMDVSHNNEVTILKALQTCGVAYRFAGFAESVYNLVKLSSGEASAAVIALKEEKLHEANVELVNFTKLLISFGMSRMEVGDLLPSLNEYAMHATMLGKTEGLVEWSQ